MGFEVTVYHGSTSLSIRPDGIYNGSVYLGSVFAPIGYSIVFFADTQAIFELPDPTSIYRITLNLEDGTERSGRICMIFVHERYILIKVNTNIYRAYRDGISGTLKLEECRHIYVGNEILIESRSSDDYFRLPLFYRREDLEIVRLNTRRGRILEMEVILDGRRIVAPSEKFSLRGPGSTTESFVYRRDLGFLKIRGLTVKDNLIHLVTDLSGLIPTELRVELARKNYAVVPWPVAN